MRQKVASYCNFLLLTHNEKLLAVKLIWVLAAAASQNF